MTLGRGKSTRGNFSMWGKVVNKFLAVWGDFPVPQVGKTLYCVCNTTGGITCTNRTVSMDFEILEAKILIFLIVRASRIKNCSAHFCASERHYVYSNAISQIVLYIAVYFVTFLSHVLNFSNYSIYGQRLEWESTHRLVSSTISICKQESYHMQWSQLTRTCFKHY